jgi:hypothetical protein
MLPFPLVRTYVSIGTNRVKCPPVTRTGCLVNAVDRDFTAGIV